jgi:beta-lactam-binding protein with PASTA domain/predicted Ser/Thr protein kinase
MSETTTAAAQELFGDRYEIQRAIGRGGMADVFLAHDRLLDRPVAVKVLFSEFSGDTTFVERFRREAQSAANLNHPNVVAVYDWGERDDTYFIVMEYVEGRTLADIVRGEGPLHPDRAAEIASDIAAALAFAHRNGVIHRDIKPGNVLITAGGQVKVADFGIAQPIDHPEDLATSGSVVGTAAYFSPEQAQGGSLDPRSDLYSLGCVLFELLVGRAPFTGDTPAEIAHKQVHEAAVPPSQLGDDIPTDLDAITMKLLAKNPANRYASAEDARADLRRFREGKPVEAEGVLAGEPDAFEIEGIEVDEPPRRVGVLVASLVILLAVLAGLLALLADSVGNDSADLATDEVPDVTELEVGAARDLLSDAGFIPVTQFEENDDYDEQVVFGQNPPAGTKLEVGSEVVLRVSSGGSTVPVPDVVGTQSTVARSLLESNGFVVRETEQFHPVAAIGEVVDQDPPARQDVARGMQVTIYVSQGPEPLEIPDLKGRSRVEATNALDNLGFQVAEFQEESEEIEEDRVIRTDPPAGEKLAPGSTVTIIVSTGKFVRVPDVLGLLSGEAIAALRGNDLNPTVEIQILPAGDPNHDRVLDQDPDPGQEIPKAGIVVLRVGFAEPTPTTTRPPATTTTRPQATTTTRPPTTRPTTTSQP